MKGPQAGHKEKEPLEHYAAHQERADFEPSRLAARLEHVVAVKAGEPTKPTLPLPSRCSSHCPLAPCDPPGVRVRARVRVRVRVRVRG